MLANFVELALEDAVLEVAGAEVNHHVEQVDQIGRVVKREPEGHSVVVDLLEGKAVTERPEVVEEGQADHHGPVMVQRAGRIEHAALLARLALVGHTGDLVAECASWPASRLVR